MIYRIVGSFASSDHCALLQFCADGLGDDRLDRGGHVGRSAAERKMVDGEQHAAESQSKWDSMQPGVRGKEDFVQFAQLAVVVCRWLYMGYNVSWRRLWHILRV